MVKAILVGLVNSLRASEEKGRRRLVYARLDPMEFFTSRGGRPYIAKAVSTRIHPSNLT